MRKTGGNAVIVKVRLGDVATYINGYAFKPTDFLWPRKKLTPPAPPFHAAVKPYFRFRLRHPIRI